MYLDGGEELELGSSRDHLLAFSAFSGRADNATNFQVTHSCLLDFVAASPLPAPRRHSQRQRRSRACFLDLLGLVRSRDEAGACSIPSSSNCSLQRLLSAVAPGRCDGPLQNVLAVMDDQEFGLGGAFVQVLLSWPGLPVNGGSSCSGDVAWPVLDGVTVLGASQPNLTSFTMQVGHRSLCFYPDAST